MKNILKAIRERRLNHSYAHFDKTEWGRRLQTLKDIHKGDRCFIVGNGPSLTAQDLDKLVNEKTFAFNRIFLIFDQTEWRPTYFCTQDNKILRQSADEIFAKIPTPYKFVPINLKWFEGIQGLQTDYFFAAKTADGNRHPQFSEDIAKYICTGNTVAYTAIQIAVYMGFKDIYLIGVDHSFSVSKNEKGEIIRDPNAKDYFTDKYNKDKDDLFVPIVDLSTQAFQSAKEYADTHDVNIYNATRGGKLEVFPRVELDSLF